VSTRRHWTRHLAALAAVVTLAAGLDGCTSSSRVTLTNVSDSWISVRFFVGKLDSTELSSRRAFQIQPGETAKFAVSRNATGRASDRLVHLQVESVTPSWEGPGRQYWMEMLTEGPIKVVVSGEGDKLHFETGEGMLAEIPKRQLKKRFEHHIANAPTQE
jgi:hypothetical protein